MYDIFYVSKSNIRSDDWKILKSKYPTAQSIENVSSFSQIRDRAFTKMFWVIWDDVKLLDSFSLTDYRATQWDNMYVHVFKNGEHFDGICLFPKSLDISSREFHHRFFTNKKEVDIQASIPNKYNIYCPNTYEEYQHIEDDMFWLVWPEVNIIDTTVFDLYFSHHNSYDRRENHVFKNLCNDVQSFQSGIILCSKFKKLSKKEFDNQYAVDKKEYNTVVSRFCYPVYKIENYEEYLEICKNEKQKMFWVIWPEIEIIDDNIFDFSFDFYNNYDKTQNHVFKNLCNDVESYLNGVVLFSTLAIISKKEFTRRYLIEKKEHNRVVSRNRYPRYYINTYTEYLEICKNEKQKMFWVIWPEIEIIDDTIFDLYFDPNNGKYDSDRMENHVFKHQFNNQHIFINSVVLFSKEKLISNREFTHRFLIEKKEHNRVVSKHRLYDIIFISYDEKNAEENFNKLVERYPRARRVHGVKGIHQAHIKAAKLCSTDMMWVVDGDAHIADDFDLDVVMSSYDIDCVHVWQSQNPINNLKYGNGGIKLLPKNLTLEMNINTSDMTTSISKKFKAMSSISNITNFNTDEFTTWRSAFRECCKLASRVIDRQYDDETSDRLNIWCTVGADKPYGLYSIMGATMGKKYGLENKNNPESLIKINDFDWLKGIFDNVK